ncbi:putative c2 domain-containing protein [Rosellinia necatrix]|uniref:Putative c2 domain-containing protein n=1 Tax=Rosellinia necatrix TaxID=77044 RepID=A0A1W2TSY6_ROSNE|nr:putative c2 domain-containing protein [Rosellinia necatrix]
MSSDPHGIGNTDNVQQPPSDTPLPDPAGVPQHDGNDGNDGIDGNHERTPPQRRSTMMDKFKDRKEKLKTKANPPGGFDSTPIPDAPPGYTVRFTFHRAENLPVADISTGASDPFITATLSTSLPKRHKEDADLCYRTRTIRRSLEPHWEEEWIVANIPSSGFRLKCRLYDEDWPDHNDRLGNVTIYETNISESWQGSAPPGKVYEVKKRMGSKRAYALKAATTAFHKGVSMTPRLYISIVCLGKSNPPHGQIYTIGPTYYFKHFSPMIGRMMGIKVNKDEADDAEGHDNPPSTGADGSNAEKNNPEKRAQKYDFQANEIQLAGPVPPKLYHRYVEFRPIIGLLFQGAGLRGRILNKALHHQHERIYNFDKSTEWGTFEPCSKEASLQFLKMAHFDEGARLFTYIITLDGLMRFTETGKEFGIDLLSKHTMHSDAHIYIACSGEFFIKKTKKPDNTHGIDSGQPVHSSSQAAECRSHKEASPANSDDYHLIIDNDSGTYRPDKSVLPDLRAYLERNFPGLHITAPACDDPEHQKLKEKHRSLRKKEGHNVRMVLNRSPSASSFSSSDISDLDNMERAGEEGRKSKKERAWELLEEPRRIKEAINAQSNRSNAAPSTSQAGEAHVGGNGNTT